MPRPRVPNPNGRGRGTQSKATMTLHDICKQKGIHPFERLLELANHPMVEVQLPALKELCQYLYPKRKAIELTGENGGAVKVQSTHAPIVLAELKALLMSGMKERK